MTWLDAVAMVLASLDIALWAAFPFYLAVRG